MLQQDRSGIETCELCDIDTKTGDYVNCYTFTGFTKDDSKILGNPPSNGDLGTLQQSPGNRLIFNPPNNAKTFSNNSK